MSILAIGSIAYDNIQTPFAKGRKKLGGSLTYFSLAASYFAPVKIVGVVGKNFKPSDFKILNGRKIDLTGLKVENGKTFEWSGLYGYDLNTRQTLSTRLNVFKNFKPEIPDQYKSLKYVFLGNIDPRLQLSVLKQMDRPRLVALDTMNYWIAKKRGSLLNTLKFVDLLIINESEVRLLAKKHNLAASAKIVLSHMEATKKAGRATLIIKQGEYGCLLFNRKGWFSLPALPLENVFDPTGAGDSFAGGLVGFIASQKIIDDKTIKKAALYGTVMASFAVESLGCKNLVGLSKQKISNRLERLRKIVKI